MRKNPFEQIYKECNIGTPESKYLNPRPFPLIFDIELTNHCNFNCLFCPTGTNTSKRDRGFMNDDVFNIFLKQVIGKNVGLRFIRWGEPTLHKKFIQYFIKAKSEGLLCHLNTNGMLLTDEHFKQLVDMKFDSVKFSFQGIDAKSFKEMRNKDVYDALLNQIKRLHEIRGNNIYPYIHAATTITYETEEQVNQFRLKLDKFCDLVTVGHTKLEHIDIESSSLSIEEKERFINLASNQTLVKRRLSCCPEVFDKLSINWDGSVTACCGDYDNLMLIGDLRKSTIEEIWNSDKLNTYRQLLSNHEYDKIDLCKNCFDYMSIQN